MRPQTYTSPAIGFAQRGFAAVIVMRRGYGHSTGAFSETLGPCDNRNYVRAGRTASIDVLAALAALRQGSWVDPTRVILVGHSMGGFAVLAAVAGNPPDGVLGVISFAGAVGSPRPDFICQPDRLIEADRIFGLTSRIPSLWIFAENDHYFGPELARGLRDAYVSNGAPASLFAAPSLGNDGHLLIFSADQTVWWPSVSAFLEKLRLPAKVQVALPPLPHLAAPVALNEEGRTAFAAYELSRSYEKAFAVDRAGHFGMAFGQRNKVSAGQAALKNCPQTETTCVVYAIDNELAPVGGK
jgi:dienelactone hydrolase